MTPSLPDALIVLVTYLRVVTGVQGAEESGHDRNLTLSQSGPVAAETVTKRKADAEIMDEQIPVKKMKTGKSLMPSSSSVGCSPCQHLHQLLYSLSQQPFCPTCDDVTDL